MILNKASQEEAPGSCGYRDSLCLRDTIPGKPWSSNSVSVTLLRFLFDRSSKRSIKSKGEKLQTKKHIVIQNWKKQPCN